MGYITFIRHLVSLKVIDLVSVLNPLSSNKNKFNWTSEHDNAFKKIKEILNMDLNYQELDSEDYIKIIYSDEYEI